MKPIFKLVDTQQREAFQIMKVNEASFFPSWHYHPEFEIMHVQEGTGLRFVGDSVDRFGPGEVVLIGSNMPHLYRSDREYDQTSSDYRSRAIVVYFKENFLGDGFLSLPQVAPLNKLLYLAKWGILFTGETSKALSRQMQQLNEHTDGLAKIIDLLAILRTMSEVPNYRLLSTQVFAKYTDEKDYERINKVYQFIITHHIDNPTLEQVAEVASLSPTAFCRYFKSHTNKTYTQFLNEIKIGNACKLMIDSKLPIGQICFEAGFNNFTHFNSQFKKITGLSPKKYQNAFINGRV